MSLFVRLWHWLVNLFAAARVPEIATPSRPEILYWAETCDDEPDILALHRVYLVGDGGAPWKASLICPCGCEQIIQLSLLQKDRPHWRATVKPGGAVTLHPSIWRVRGCRSHFHIRDGRVLWWGPDAKVPVMLMPPIKPGVDRRI